MLSVCCGCELTHEKHVTFNAVLFWCFYKRNHAVIQLKCNGTILLLKWYLDKMSAVIAPVGQ